jgi:hypothetical protein
MTTHKRLAPHRDKTFRRPQFDCYACHDTGLLTNGDGLVRQYLPDYDCKPDGLPCGGHDLAMVCWCKAAYKQLGPDGQLVRGGYREDSGAIAEVQSANGLQLIGSELSKEITRELHSTRRQRWIEAEQSMSVAREAGEAPWFISESRVAIEGLEGSQRASSGLQSLGSILSGHSF